jgi:glycine cleavage system aminomethyltransferase T
MSLHEQVGALRRASVLASMDHIVVVRLRGDDAFAIVDALCTSELFVRGGQVLHTLFLSEDARPFADVYVLRDDESFLLLVEGPSASELIAYIRAHAPQGTAVVLDDLSATHDVLGIHGPYAWQVMEGLAGPEIIGVPYLTFLHLEDWTCVRAGKTGEFGYDLLVPKHRAPALRERIEHAGRETGLVHAALPALEHCALENWFFNIRREGRLAVTPIELQLQWRVAYAKPFVGHEALRDRRARGPDRRLTCVTSPTPLSTDDVVALGNSAVGVVVNAGLVPTGDHDAAPFFTSLALLDIDVAHPGIDELVASGSVHVTTVSPPTVDNRSLHVNPQRDRYAPDGARS